MKLHLPRVSGTTAAASARLENGEGLLLGQDWTTDGMWLVRIRGDDDTACPTFVPVAALVARPFGFYSFHLPIPQPSGGWYTRSTVSEGWRNRDLWPAVIDRRGLIAGLAASDLEAADLSGGHLARDLHLPGFPEVARRWRSQVASLEERIAGTACLKLRFGFVGPEVVDGLSSGQFGPGWAAELLGHRLIGATRFGGTFDTLAGEYRLYVKDHDVEISGGANSPDPIVDVLFEGIDFWCRPTPLSDGRIATLVELGWQEEVLEPVSRQVVLSTGQGWYSLTSTPSYRGEIELPSASRVQNGSLLVLEPGEWELVACSTVPRVEGTFVAVLRIVRK